MTSQIILCFNILQILLEIYMIVNTMKSKTNVNQYFKKQDLRLDFKMGLKLGSTFTETLVQIIIRHFTS